MASPEALEHHGADLREVDLDPPARTADSNGPIRIPSPIFATASRASGSSARSRCQPIAPPENRIRVTQRDQLAQITGTVDHHLQKTCYLLNLPDTAGSHAPRVRRLRQPRHQRRRALSLSTDSNAPSIYLFFAEIEGHCNDPLVAEAEREINDRHATRPVHERPCILLGSYPNTPLLHRHPRTAGSSADGFIRRDGVARVIGGGLRSLPFTILRAGIGSPHSDFVIASGRPNPLLLFANPRFPMSFVETYNRLPHEKSALLRRMEQLLAPMSAAQLEGMAAEAARLTRQHFGRTMRLFAPLYLSNECINNCAYCGFSRDNPILRVTLTVDQVVREARASAGAGIPAHPARGGRASEVCLQRLPGGMPAAPARRRARPLAIEVGPMETAEYGRMVRCRRRGPGRLSGNLRPRGLRGVSHRRTEARFRLAARMSRARLRRRLSPHRPRRALRTRRLADGGARARGASRIPAERTAGRRASPSPFRGCVRRPADFSRAPVWTTARSCNSSAPSASVSRRPASCSARANPPHCATRCCRSASPRMSAGSHTEPGGYTGQGRDDLHLTVRGRRVELEQHSACDEPPASSTSPITAPRQRSPRCCAGADSIPSGKTGTPRSSQADHPETADRIQETEIRQFEPSVFRVHFQSGFVRHCETGFLQTPPPPPFFAAPAS